jgi:O-succinylbenzoate synthase
MVRLETEDGRAGYGEAATLPWFGTESAEAAEAVCRDLGAEVDDQVLARVPADYGCLRNALATARPDRVEADPAGPEPKPRPVAALLPAGRSALARIPPLVEAGFRVFKWKVGMGEVADEITLLDDVCALLPSGSKLRLDANGAWTRRQAERWLERAAERPVEYVEQPAFAKPTAGTALRRQTEDLLLGLAGDFPTPIALDESLVGDGDVARWLALGWRGVFVVKPSLFSNTTGVLQQLEAAKADVVFSSALETAVGAKSALGHAFHWRGPVRALGFGVWPLFADARFDGPGLAPFLRWPDVTRIKVEVVWNALN